MSVLSRLHFVCDSPQLADSVMAEHFAMLEAVRQESVPTVLMGSCCGLRMVELTPPWVNRRVADADPKLLGMSAFRTARFDAESRSWKVHMVIEINDDTKEGDHGSND